MSTLEGLLIFAGIPLLIVVAITVMVMAPSLAKGNQPRSGRNWQAASEWFGAPRTVRAEAAANPHQIESGPGAGYNPASAGDHDNVVMDEPGGAGDRGPRGDRDGGGDRGVATDAGATHTGAHAVRGTSAEDPSRDQTGGASVRW